MSVNTWFEVAFIHHVNIVVALNSFYIFASIINEFYWVRIVIVGFQWTQFLLSSFTIGRLNYNYVVLATPVTHWGLTSWFINIFIHIAMQPITYIEYKLWFSDSRILVNTLLLLFFLLSRNDPSPRVFCFNIVQYCHRK